MKALFIGAHNDDIEYGAGGMACLLKEAGFEIHFLKIACKRREYKKSGPVPAYHDPALCAEFCRQDVAAGDVFGAHTNIISDYKNDYYMVTNENMMLLRDAVEEVLPDIAFIHWMQDNHFDHVQASRASFQVLCSYASCEIHAFEAGPWQSMTYMTPDFLVDITGAMPTVERSLLLFDQPSAGGRGLVAEKRAAAQFRGYMADYPFAEAYKILRYPPRRLGTELLLPRLLGERYRWAGSDAYPMGMKYYL